MWLLVHDGQRLHAETWRTGQGFVDFVARRWREPDAGIWERRDEPRHYVHSKLMAWLALDRGLRIAERQRTRTSRLHRWRAERDALRAELLSRGFDAQRQTF